MSKKQVSGIRRFFNVMFHTLFIIFIISGGTIIFHNVYYVPVKIVGRSMEPTLQDSEFGVMDTNSWRVDRIERFDIVIVQPSLMVDKYIIKRVIGLPGDRVVFDNNGELFVNNAHISQDFIAVDPYRLATCPWTTSIGCFSPITLGDNQYYVLGDNRGNSYDSRAIGPFDIENIVGVLFAIEGVCLNGETISEAGVALQSCAVRTYRWPTFY
ncbi:MAG TPA: signal peptidase I [Firmicutes bacterium]|nr:signal peptidase I [Bacillota bacterium]